MTAAVYTPYGMTNSARAPAALEDLVELFDSKWFGDASSSSGGRHGFLGGSRKNVRSYASLGSGPSELSSTGSRGHLDGLSGTDWGLTVGADLLDNSPRPLNGPTKKNGQTPVVLEDSLSPLMPLVSGAGAGEPSIRGGMVTGSRKTTSPPRPAPEPRSPMLEKDETPDGRLGTWAGRQRVFADFLREEQAGGAGPEEEEEGVVGSVPHSDTTAEGLEPGSVTSMGGHIFQSESGDRREETRRKKREKGPSSAAPAVLRPPPVPHDSVTTPAEDDEMNMAWRWRFTRKWQIEQAKQFDPTYGQEPDNDDDWDTALGLMRVHGNDLADLATTASVEDRRGGLGAALAGELRTPSMLEASPSFSAPMLLDTAGSAGGTEPILGAGAQNRDGEAAPATRRLRAVAQKARHLRARQAEIEHEVAARWETTAANTAWVGAHLEPAVLDHWGRYGFVLSRLRDGSDHRKLLVRGRNGVNEAGLAAALDQEVAQAAIKHRLMGARVEVLASGIMEWARGRDRTVRVRVTALGGVADPLVRSVQDATRIVAEIIKRALPSGTSIIEESVGASNGAMKGARKV